MLNYASVRRPQHSTVVLHDPMTNPYEPPEPDLTPLEHNPMRSQVPGKILVVWLVASCLLLPTLLWIITLVLSNVVRLF
jgi:hypothetical protein